MAERRPTARSRGAILAVAGIGALAIACGGSARAPSPTAATARASNVLIITIDTLRADRVGAYGWGRARTPAIDALAARGVRFDRAYATSPITLPSHASLLTGLYPPGHRSRANGMRVRAGLNTLASTLHQQGWATGAFVGAFPLDRRFGLDRGFDVYGDRMPRNADGHLLNERPGRVVVDEALAWLGGIGPGRHVFVWVHLFEPHAPYEPDPARGPGGRTLPPEVRYDDEVARADAEVGRLIAGLGDRGRSTLIVLAGDHGEAFGEHGELTHSLFLYDTTLRVPLVLAGPGLAAVPAGVQEAVSLVDVYATVLDGLGLDGPDTDGVTLMPLTRGGAIGPRELYAETFAPLVDFGWSAFRSVRSGGLKYIASPHDELYDIARDPEESRNLKDGRGVEVKALAARVAAYAGPELPADQVGGRVKADARSRLNALGYTSGTPTVGPGGLRPDPKDKRTLAARLALAMSGEVTGTALRDALVAVLTEDPGNALAHTRLGYVLVEEGRVREAEPHFRAALTSGVPTADAYLGLALCLVATNRRTAALQPLEDALRVEPGNPVVEANLGNLALDADRLDVAIRHLSAAVERDPDLHQARFNLARALARAGRRVEALAQAQELLVRLPADAPQRPEVERLLRALR
ncbi:MAG: sulfatase-like hydrolase/transferase [Acidobacteria bacterium]|nr:sulfatase-like hydrolase/transferase [Acidobacteriota bacterium]